jgi:ABC-type bacteriocin/lantibiotic exporter with double-glycine peptidase domain
MRRKKIFAATGLIALSGSTVSVIMITSMLGLSDAEQDLVRRREGRTPATNEGVLLQKNHNDCGPTALQMIFDYYGVPSSVHDIEAHVVLTERGSSMLALKEMAELKGLQAEGWRLTLQDFSKISFPALLFVHNDHYLIADSIYDDSVFVRDPAIGRVGIPKRKLPQIWKGEVLVFGRK